MQLLILIVIKRRFDENCRILFFIVYKKFQRLFKDTRLFRKILNVAEEIPYPGELKNIIKTSLAFSDVNKKMII